LSHKPPDAPYAIVIHQGGLVLSIGEIAFDRADQRVNAVVSFFVRFCKTVEPFVYPAPQLVDDPYQARYCAGKLVNLVRVLIDLLRSLFQVGRELTLMIREELQLSFDSFKPFFRSH
jgi:hypothetical protein